MKLAFCSISALDRPIAPVAEMAASLGLDGVEVTARPPHLDPKAPLEEARAAGQSVRDAGVEVIAYGSYLGRFGERTLDQARREVEIANALETKLLRVWAEPDPESTQDDFASIVELMQTACDAAAGSGITVVVERHIGSFADTPKRIDALLSAVARPNFALNYQVLDLIPSDAAEAQPDDARRLAGLGRYFHLKNFRPNPDEQGPLLPGGSLGGGVLDYKQILSAAFEAGYDGPLTIEFLAFEPRPVEEKLAEDVESLRSILKERGRA